MRKAIPTQYKNVKYRSKTEAILARAFDLLGWLHIYEPFYYEIESGYIPDFHICKKQSYEGFDLGGFSESVWEIKPSACTESYTEYLRKNFHEIREIHPTCNRLSFILCVVNPFEKKPIPDVFEIEKTDPYGWRRWYITDMADLYGAVIEAREYRFDLVHE